jgi:hypothetical protein
MPEILQWIIGLVGISLFLGTIAVGIWHRFLCWLMDIECKAELKWPKRPVTETGFLTGVIERTFFTVAVATNLSGTAIAMIAWITVKYYISWKDSTEKNVRKQAMASLLSGMVSMLVALTAGHICN